MRTRQHRAQQGLGLELGEVDADTGVRAVAPAGVGVRLPVEVEALGVGELGLVEVGGAEEQDDAGSGRERCAVDLGVVGDQRVKPRTGEARRTLSTTVAGTRSGSARTAA